MITPNLFTTGICHGMRVFYITADRPCPYSVIRTANPYWIDPENIQIYRCFPIDPAKWLVTVFVSDEQDTLELIRSIMGY